MVSGQHIKAKTVMVAPNFDFENECIGVIAGCDEAGRGPLCGPVVAGAVIFLKTDIDMPLITDSKKMSRRQRQIAYDWLTSNPDVLWVTAFCTPSEIDELNILHASMLAMKRAVDNLSITPDFCLIDGNRVPKDLNGRAIVKGDSKSLSIAAASIIAKETRDSIMRGLHNDYPMYGWDHNAGYPTKEHLEAIAKHGITKHHRKTFKGVK